MNPANYPRDGLRTVKPLTTACAPMIGMFVLLLVSLLVGLLCWDIYRVHVIAGNLSEYRDLSAVDGLSKYRFLFPDEATNIYYCASLDFYYITTAFDLHEAEFLEWVDEHGWTPTPKKRIFVDIETLESGGGLDIPPFDGLHYREMPVGDIKGILYDISVAFDPLKERVYLRYTVTEGEVPPGAPVH